MPPTPSFDYYAELQVEKTASIEQLTTAYRRLARVHHPDKNPDKTEEATTAFQKIQLAYEVLSDPAQRARYDARSSSSSARAAQSDYYGSSPRGFHAYYDDDTDDEFFFPDRRFWYDFRAGPSRHFEESFPDFFRFFNFRTRDDSAWRQAEAKREKERREELAAEFAERRAREEAEAAVRKAKKQAEEDAREKEKAKLQDEERAQQEARWKKLNARTDDEKLAACLHSDFCAKVPQKQKFKCAACGAKRGMTAFECPYCATSLCQLCVSNSSLKRAKVELDQKAAPVPETKPVPEAKPEKVNAERKPSNGEGHKRRQNRGPIRCYNCGVTGHKAKDCYERAGRDESRVSTEGQKKPGNARAKGKPKGRAQADGNK